MPGYIKTNAQPASMGVYFHGVFKEYSRTSIFYYTNIEKHPLAISEKISIPSYKD
jgi:hypothetical protein